MKQRYEQKLQQQQLFTIANKLNLIKTSEKMVGGRLGERIEVSEEVIKKACTLSEKAHSSSKNPYKSEKISSSEEIVFGFSGSWSVDDWFARNTEKAFGDIEVDHELFPSLRSIGNDVVAQGNEAFIRRFREILRTSTLQNEVQKAVNKKKRVVFAGHSSGGAVAIFVTIWFLDKYLRGADSSQNSPDSPRCITFGSPLVGDRIFSHALRRENWADFFIHFVMKYDIVPRIMLTPRASIEQQFRRILAFFNPKSSNTEREAIGNGEAETFFMTVMRNASSVASQAACSLKGSTNLLLETLTNFIQLSPYRPFGTYIFCSGNGNLAVVKNPDAILQLLFYCSQLSEEGEAAEIAKRSLVEHLISGYKREVKESLGGMQSVVYLDPTDVPLTSDASASPEVATINRTLNDLGLSTTARLCLRAAGELEKQKRKNQEKVDSYIEAIEDKLNRIKEYQNVCRVRKIGYYDAFKCMEAPNDFDANVKRLELAGMWDEVIEMLKGYELPDEFEGRKEWIELGTKFRRLVEPLDISNYYRHSRNNDTGAYMKPGCRPKRYRYPQRWREHDKRMAPNSSSESCFWAMLEGKIVSNERLEEDAEEIKKEALKWTSTDEGEDVFMEGSKDVFLEGSTFVKWWRALPHQPPLPTIQAV